MKKLVLAIPLLLIVLSCTESSSSKSYPYAFLQSKTQGADQMDLYAYSGNIDIGQLKEFCLSKKAKYQSGTFYFVVLFDDSKNAVFPSSPFTSEYGMEELPLSHIRAYYTFNRLNGYSKLDLYEKNKWESSPNSMDIK